MNQRPLIEAHLEPTPEDALAFEAAHHLRQPQQRAGARLRRFAAPAVGAGLVAALPLLGVRGLGPLPALAAGLGLVWALAWPWAERRLVARRLRALAAGRPAVRLPPLQLRWNGAALEVQAAGGAPVRLPLSALGPVVIDGPRIYIYTAQHAALIFPAGQAEALAAALRAAVEARGAPPVR
ncbi:MAG: hypothetical protein JNM72_07695 [Deltaproteobacteria bacterium]|jgi:hypothetical protein|nr:hypothetical protein [Deltaproteobacteria bacterium]